MPNWVFNTLSMEGDKEEIKKVVEALASPYKALRDPNKFGEETTLPFEETVVTPEGGISFMNCIAPSDIVGYYCMYRNLDGTPKDNQAVNLNQLSVTQQILTNQIAPSEQEVLAGHDWYNWNVANWGTKWDVCNAYSEGDGEYQFDTAWSPPIEAITHLSRKFPEIEFTLNFQEEQGWGGESLFQGGQETKIKDYDIPESHKEEVENTGECRHCVEETDSDYWYDDCPKKMELQEA